MWNTGKNFFVSEPILIRFGVQMYLGDILAHTKSYQDWLRIGCAGQISILLHKLLWCSISLLWKNDIFWHLDWFFEIFGNELPIFLHGWLEGLQGFHLERVWLYKNFYFLVRNCLESRGKNLKNNSSVEEAHASSVRSLCTSTNSVNAPRFCFMHKAHLLV